jgi:multicomponent Na+:H+ antiporter subunit F
VSHGLPFEWTAPVLFVILAAGIALSVVRMFRGPSLPDRAVAFDVVSLLAVGLIVAYAVHVDEGVFLDVAIVVALITFIATVGIATFLTRRERVRRQEGRR